MSWRRRFRHLPVCAVVLAVTLLALAPVASADVGETIIVRCTHNESLAGFTPSQYEQALKELEATTEEYSNCAQRIRSAELAAAAGPRGGGGGAGGTGGAGNVAIAASPAEQRSIEQAAKSGPPEPLRIQGDQVAPGVVHADIASALNTLPTPLLANLGFLIACALAFGGFALRSRLRGRGRSG